MLYLHFHLAGTNSSGCRSNRSSCSDDSESRFKTKGKCYENYYKFLKINEGVYQFGHLEEHFS